jgi:hypothetical protein
MEVKYQEYEKALWQKRQWRVELSGVSAADVDGLRDELLRMRQRALRGGIVEIYVDGHSEPLGPWKSGDLWRPTGYYRDDGEHYIRGFFLGLKISGNPKGDFKLNGL